MRTTIKRGSRGDDVRALQRFLSILVDDNERPYHTDTIDGIFGANTAHSVLEFQADYESLDNDGIVGPLTWGALEQAICGVEGGEPETQAEVIAPALGADPCPDDVWSAWIDQFVPTLVDAPVRYGPGRGLFVDDEMVVTYGPGRLESTNWRGRKGIHPSFHCSAFTNFFLGWVTRRGDDYTHRGNIPSLYKLVTNDNELHIIGDNARMTYRGYAPWCRRIAPDEQYITAADIWELRRELPTFLVWGYSTKRGGTWKWWHHTGMFIVDHRSSGTPMYRIAADGFKKDGVWSSTAMRYRPIDEAWCRDDVGTHVYRPFGVVGLDSVAERPLARVALESL